MEQAILPNKKRIDSIDMLRGIIMIIMALDHVRDFFHISAMTDDPTNLATTTPFLFFTRWITHFCAPVFVFLAGTSAFLYGSKKTKKELSSFLLKRGIWLLFVDTVIMSFLFSFDPLFHATIFQVIWVTGISMILLSVCIYLPFQFIFTIGLIMILGHNLLDRFNTIGNTQPSMWWAFLHQSTFLEFPKGHFLGILYPLIPWPGIMFLGYCLGTYFKPGSDASIRRTFLIRAGRLTVIAFFVIRLINLYGDLVPWAEQNDISTTIISFFNVTKYPPSLAYCCMTIGPALLLLVLLENAKARWTNFVVIYGRVPMFYYLVHFFIIHFSCMLLFFISGYPMSQMAESSFLFRPLHFGYNLWIVYGIWILLIIILYPMCKRYSVYKATHDHWWLSYL